MIFLCSKPQSNSGGGKISRMNFGFKGYRIYCILIRWMVLPAILGIVVATYVPALRAGALFMDDEFYLGAPEIRHPSFASVKKFFIELREPSVVKGYYQPMALLSMMLDFLDPTAAYSLMPFHRTSLLLHLINVSLVTVIFYLLFGNWLICCFCSMLYGLHPLNTDVVLWVAERKAVLSTCFALGSIVFYLLYVTHANRMGRVEWKRYGASLFLYLCSVLSKPTAVSIALLLFVFDYWPLKRLNRHTVIEKIPFLIIFCLSSVVTLVSQTRSFDAGNIVMLRLPYIPFVITYGIGTYLFKAVWPAGPVYDYQFPNPFSLTNQEVLIPVLIILCIIILIVFSVSLTPSLLAGSLFFFIAILPAIGVIRFTSSVVSNRFIYLPMVGFLLPICHLLNGLWVTRGHPIKRTGIRIFIITAFAVLAVATARETRRYELQWRDSLSLLKYYIKRSPNDWKLYTRLGNEWVKRGDYDSAIVEFTHAVLLNPDWAENHLNLGRALFIVGRFAEAKTAFAAALELTPHDWRGHVLMGLTLSRQNNTEAGLKELEIAARLEPLAAEAHFYIAQILAQQGKKKEAVNKYMEVLNINPKFEEARKALDSLMAETK